MRGAPDNSTVIKEITRLPRCVFCIFITIIQSSSLLHRTRYGNARARCIVVLSTFMRLNARIEFIAPPLSLSLSPPVQDAFSAGLCGGDSAAECRKVKGTLKYSQNYSRASRSFETRTRVMLRRQSHAYDKLKT